MSITEDLRKITADVEKLQEQYRKTVNELDTVEEERNQAQKELNDIKDRYRFASLNVPSSDQVKTLFEYDLNGLVVGNDDWVRKSRLDAANAQANAWGRDLGLAKIAHDQAIQRLKWCEAALESQYTRITKALSEEGIKTAAKAVGMHVHNMMKEKHGEAYTAHSCPDFEFILKLSEIAIKAALDLETKQ
jgi:DNA gyrase/topoisomerase IV subunit A